MRKLFVSCRLLCLTFCLSVSVFCVSVSYASVLEEGKKMMYYQRYERAVEIFQKLIAEEKEKSKVLPLAYYHLGEVYLIRRKLAKAKELFQETLKRLPADPIIMVGLGRVLLAENLENEAKPLFENALQQTKNKNIDVFTGILLAYAHSKYGNADYILNKLKDPKIFSEKITRTPEFYLALGDLYKHLRKANETYSNYQLALIKKSSSLEAHYKMGRFFLVQGNIEGFVDNMEEAIKEDPRFAPAYYELYAYYYNSDVNKAKDYFLLYKKNTDVTPGVEYEEASIFYASKNYDTAIIKTKILLRKEKEHRDLRCYRLIGYSYYKLDSLEQAKLYLDSFFVLAQKEDADIIQPSNYKLMGDILSRIHGQYDASINYYIKAYREDTVLKNKLSIIDSVVNVSKKNNDLKTAVQWLGLSYNVHPGHSKNRLFKWGIAAMKAEQYELSDSIFNLYIVRYPEEYYGYYYKAKSSLSLDTSHIASLPLFQKTIEVASVTDSAREKNKNIILKCYEVLYGYEMQKTKNYEKAIQYLDSLIILDPDDTERQTTKANLTDYLEKQKKYEEDMKRYEEKKRRRYEEQKRSHIKKSVRK